jgi:hypothetical protein
MPERVLKRRLCKATKDRLAGAQQPILSPKNEALCSFIVLRLCRVFVLDSGGKSQVLCFVCFYHVLPLSLSSVPLPVPGARNTFIDGSPAAGSHPAPWLPIGSRSVPARAPSGSRGPEYIRISRHSADLRATGLLTERYWGPPGPYRNQPGADREPIGNQSGTKREPARRRWAGSWLVPGWFPIGSRSVPDWFPVGSRLVPARAPSGSRGPEYIH